MADGQRKAAVEAKSYWRPLRPGERIYDLTDMVEGPAETEDPFPAMAPQREPVPSQAPPRSMSLPVPDHIETIIVETTKRLVRELAPDIIERVIREEIEKLRMEDR